MDELLAYLDIPYTIIPVELEPIRLMVVNKVYEWKLQKMQHSHVKSLAKAQRQCAEYSSIVDLMGKIAVCTTRREVIGKIKEIFSLVFGVEYFKYWSANYDQGTIPADIEEFMVDQGKEFIFSNEDKRFSIKISWKGKLYGVIDVWGFMFPQYFEKYLNFALEISKICGVVFSNIEQYEKVMISEQELRYISYHDSSTGLFNRSYINDYASKYDPKQQPTVFAFDIDRLKLVNDNYGHAEGDKLIKSVADILLRCFRETDVVARIGGDEFVAIIPGDNMLTALLIKDRITQEIDIENKDIEDPDRKISFSIGVAISQSESDTLESLMQKADEFMYADKISKRQ